METPKRTTAGVLFWTPAPGRRSPVSSVASEDGLEDEDDDKTESDDDFISQMDENGIIGLSEGLKNAGLETRDELCLYSSKGNETLTSSVNAWTVEEELNQRKEEQGTEYLPERETFLGMAEEEEDGLEAGLIGCYSKGWTEVDIDPLVVSTHHCPISWSPTHLLHSAIEEIAAAPGIRAETLPELSLVESLSESHKSHSSLKSSPCCPDVTPRASLQPAAMSSEKVVEVKHHKRPTPSPRTSRLQSPEPTPSSSSLSTFGMNFLKSGCQALKPERQQRPPRASSEATPVDESRKRPLSYTTPDFSKVEPKVRFPKGGYKPPKSRLSSKRDFHSPEPPLVFTSPVDIVKEVLLNVQDALPATSDSYRPPTRTPDHAVPQEFRCRQHAITLLEQLQADYNTLLTKYADAENTIDRLRLEAKVNLYSDPPKPGHLVQPNLNSEASRFMMLDFPQAQRAETSSASLHLDIRSTHQERSASSMSTAGPDSLAVHRPDGILYNQADQFVQQLETFEDLLKNKSLKPVQQVKGLLQLAEKLDTLENGYLLARDEQKLCQHGDAETNPFDPDRELEALIFQFGLHIEELKEQVGQMQQVQPTCEAPLSSCHLAPSSVPSEGGETGTHPQNSSVSSLVDPGEAAAVELSSAREGKDQAAVGREIKNSLTATNGKHRHDENLTALTDQNQRLYRCSPASSRASSRSLPVDPTSSRRKFKVKTSQSSSLSSLGEITAEERRKFSLQPGGNQVLSQEGIISPEMDSGFVGSEGSRLHQMASESVLVPRKKSPRRPQTDSVSAPSPASSSSHRHTAVKDNVDSNQPKTTRQMQRRRSSSCSPQYWPSQTERSRADCGISVLMKSNSSDTMSEDEQTDHDTESLAPPHSSSISSFLDSSSHLHGDSLRAVSSSRVASRNNAIQTLQDEVTKLKERLEKCLRNATPLTSVRSAESNGHSRISAAHIRSGDRLGDISRGRRVELDPMRRTADEKPPCPHRQRPQPVILTTPEPIIPQPKPAVSRCTQTSAAASDTHTNAGHRRTHKRQNPGVPEQMYEAADEPDSKHCPTRACPQCLSRRQGRPKVPTGGNKESTPSWFNSCCLHGCTEPHRHTKSDSQTHTSQQPSPSTDGRFTSGAPPALLRHMPVCVPALFNSSGISSGVRGRRETRRRTRRSVSIDRQLFVDSSLDRAIRAARHMKLTSRHMALSLAAGLHHQESLNPSCS
ncbi:microtubule organization protein AKNA isoform X2 [Antennarius striatus]|uniref:microtubule organization protein AKNA isoform X2 n=1 Tax=Antennarius striatus TaxID=241820 RepID=UPI0035B3FCD0